MATLEVVRKIALALLGFGIGLRVHLKKMLITGEESKDIAAILVILDDHLRESF